MKLWLEIDKLFKNLLGRNVLKGNLGFWKYIDFSDEMGIDKKLKATWKVKHSTNNLAKNYEVPITNEQLSIFNLIWNFLLISACRLATSTNSFTGASQKFPFFFARIDIFYKTSRKLPLIPWAWVQRKFIEWLFLGFQITEIP